MKEKIRIETAGLKIATSGTIIILFWMGLFKFTPTEAKGIQA